VNKESVSVECCHLILAYHDNDDEIMERVRQLSYQQRRTSPCLTCRHYNISALVLDEIFKQT
jgi:hypothetical protein